MKQLTIKDIRSWNPCYDPTGISGVTEKWTGTILDILKMRNVPIKDKFWAFSWTALAEEDITDDVLINFAFRCTQYAVNQMDPPCQPLQDVMTDIMMWLENKEEGQEFPVPAIEVILDHFWIGEEKIERRPVCAVAAVSILIDMLEHDPEMKISWVNGIIPCSLTPNEPNFSMKNIQEDVHQYFVDILIQLLEESNETTDN